MSDLNASKAALRKRHRTSVLVLVLVLVAVGLNVLTAGRALADDPVAARRLFEDADAAAKRQDYRTAAQLFEEADRRAPRANAVFNAAQQWDAAGDELRAADAFATAIERGGLDPNVYRVAVSRLEELDDKLGSSLGSVLVTAPAGGFVSVAHAARIPVPARIHVPPGNVVVSIERADGSILRHEVVVVAGRATSFAPAEAPKPPPPRPPAPVQPPSGSWTAPAGWVLLVAGVSAAGVGVGLGARGLKARADWDRAGHDPAQIELHDEAVSMRTWANVLFGAAAVVGGVGATLLIVSASSSRPQRGSAKREVRVVAAPFGALAATRF